MCAERLSKKGYKSIIFEKRKNEIGGNCYTYYKNNIEIHKYGSHIFHTSKTEIYNYIKNFTDINDYKHKVYTKHNNELYNIPINISTLNSIFNVKLKNEFQVKEFLKNKSIKLKTKPKNFEEQIISTMGIEIYNIFFKEYTKKQWKTDPKNLPVSIAKRIPMVFTNSDLYFPYEKYQGIPKEGYDKLFNNLLNESKAEIVYNNFLSVKDSYKNIPVIYSGPIDEYYNYKFGVLGWRSLEFKTEEINKKIFQNNAVINFADAKPKYTRCHEYKHYRKDDKSFNQNKTIIMYEKSADFIKGKTEPYYPVNSKGDIEILNMYLALAKKEKNIFFGGRLGAYKYFDMIQTINNAFELIDAKF